MTSKKGHWVEDLFPPTFQYVAENFNLKVEKKNANRSNQQKRVLLTPENIRDIYQRVSGLALVEANDDKREETEHPKKNQDLPVATMERDLSKTPNQEAGVIWTTEELDIFRNEFSSLKRENSDLKVKIQEFSKYCSQLEERLKSSMKALDSVQVRLETTKKLNKRQAVHNDILKSELKTATSAIETLHEMNLGLMEERDGLLKKGSDLQTQLNKERFENIKLNRVLEVAKSEFTKELMSEQEGLRNVYELKIESLRGELDTAMKNYDQERDQHISTKHGLQELLRHFSSLTERVNSVKNEELHTRK